jgi:hypothetical protein
MNTTAPKPFVFVLMPFADEFDDVYKLGIKPACENAGAYAERLDQQLFTESILDRIYNQISKADVLVSDMTGRNPNVFYETGYAHALGKKVILLTKSADDIPFDLKHYQHIIYAGRIADLISELEKRVRWALEQPKGEILQHTIDFYIDGHRLPNKTEIPWPITRDDFGDNVSVYLKIDAHNPMDKQITTAKFKIGILIHHTSNMRLVTHRYDEHPLEYFKPPDGKSLFVLKKGAVLHPGSWKSFEVSVEPNQGQFKVGDSFSATIRMFSQEGVADFPFSMTLIDNEQA